MRDGLASVLALCALGILSAVFLTSGRSKVGTAELLSWDGESAVAAPDSRGAQAAMLALVAPSERNARKSRRSLALEAYFNERLHGVTSLAAVDLSALAAGLRAHLSTLSAAEAGDAGGGGSVAAAIAAETEDPFPSAAEAFSPEHQEELEAEVEALRRENAALKQSPRGAATQSKAPLWPYDESHFGYPWGYDKNNGWHQEIESYDPELDGCACQINNYHRYLSCTCGSAWGALTLQDEGCYGCCSHGCCNRCHCHTSGAGDRMGPTDCVCSLSRNWDRSNARGCPGWWRDNAGPLDPGGKGGIPEVEDTPGVLP